jgi:hypothetical protein
MALAVVFLSEHRGFPLKSSCIDDLPSSMTATDLCNRLGQYAYYLTGDPWALVSDPVYL